MRFGLKLTLESVNENISKLGKLTFMPKDD